MLTNEEQITLNAYDQIGADWASSHNSVIWQKEYLEFKNYLPSGKIIDLGCGAGKDSDWFVANGYDYTGVDISANMVKLAKQRNPKAKFLQKDFYSLDFAENEFDGFWSACSLLHIPKTKLETVLQNIKRIIRPGGLGFIAIKEGQGEEFESWENSSFKRFYVYYDSEEFAEILNRAGFLVKKQGLRPRPHDGSSNFLTYFVTKE